MRNILILSNGWMILEVVGRDSSWGGLDSDWIEATHVAQCRNEQVSKKANKHQ